MNNALLREFIASVPSCIDTDSLATVWQVFQQTDCEQMVVVDEQQIPLGLLTFRSLLPYLLGNGRLEGLNSDGASAHAELPLHQNPVLQQSLRSLRRRLDEQNRPLLEILTPLPIYWSLRQLQPYLPEIRRHQWALVNSAGQYVGLLDRLHALQSLATHPIPPSPASHASLNRQPAHAPSSAMRTLSGIDPASAVLDPLLDLLERLPIPLMLQTATGRAITQNLAWRQQVGELQDPGQVRREAALILESASEEHTGPGRHYSSVEANPQQGRSVGTTELDTDDQSWAHSGVAAQVQQPSSCQLSADPNACVCVCPMKNGQDRVWQFIKVPMGTAPALEGRGDWLSAPAQATLSSEKLSPIESGSAPQSLAQFKLATLGFSPDPAWRALAQSEELWLVLARDMTEQQQVARELAAKNADLIQLNRLKDEFLACISHELKTPLTAVLGLSSLLKDQALGQLNERQSRYAQLIHQSGRHLILIVNDILDLTRIETGQLELMLEPVQIEQVCSRAYEQAQQLQPLEVGSEIQTGAVQPAARFSLEIQPGLERLIADELRLRQMLVNLLSNALKFTEAGKEIGLRVEAWDGWIAFTVWDMGIGIPADKQHLVFQKFQQLENPMTRRYEGTGLGLVLTQRLARLHGGDVTFTSVEGRGSQFTLLLPPSPPHGTTELRTGKPRSAQPSTITSSNRLVLVVEATQQPLDNLTNQLVGLGYRVAIARSGTEALEKIRRLQPCVVFLNPLLPMLSGWDVLILLKADQETHHIPVVVTAMRVEREQAYQNGADGFLSLPVQAEALQRSLEQLVSPTENESQVAQPSLTVLHLYGSDPSADRSSASLSVQDLNSSLHLHYCRVLEVDDLEQADLLARVWKPNVILLDGFIPEPLGYVKQLSQYPFLASLPLVTLTGEVTHAANQVPGLAVFPCLIPTTTHTATQGIAQPGHGVDQREENSDKPEISALIQVMQLAAGINWTPHILVADFSALKAAWNLLAQRSDSVLRKKAEATAQSTQTSDRLRALVQYLQIAGFHSSIGQSWGEVRQQLQHQSVDLFLLCVHGSEPHPLLVEMLRDLDQLQVKPPIFAWNHQSLSTVLDEAESQNFRMTWGAIATHILPHSLSMSELLAQINQTLEQPVSSEKGFT